MGLLLFTRRLWQVRPLSPDLIECAAADVAFLIPLLEMVAPLLKSTALAAETMFSKMPSRAVAQLTQHSPHLATLLSALGEVADGVDTAAGGLSVRRLMEWAKLDVFHQKSLHNGAGLHKKH